MTLVRRTHESGLVLAEQSLDEAGLARALRQIDSRLALQFRPPFYVVVCQISEYEAPVIATWMDELGRPLPLSSGLLERVQRNRVDARNKPVDIDTHNQRLLEETRRKTDGELETLRQEHQPYIGRSRVQVTMADTGKPRYWQRDGKRPQSGKAA